MCLCHIVSGNIRYVKNALKTHDKTNGKTKEHGFIYSNRGIILLILANKSQTEISIYNTQKIQNRFSNFEV